MRFPQSDVHPACRTFRRQPVYALAANASSRSMIPICFAAIPFTSSQTPSEQLRISSVIQGAAA